MTAGQTDTSTRLDALSAVAGDTDSSYATADSRIVQTIATPALIDDSIPVTTERVGEEPSTRRRLLVNLSANIANFAVGLLAGFFLTPFLIHRLDIAVYGMIALATTMTTYLSLFSTALNSAVGRYLMIALTRRDDVEANTVFNTSLFGSLLLSGILVGPGLWFAWHIDQFVHMPPGYPVAQVRFLFSCTLLVFLLTTVGAAFEVSSFCRNRFDLRNIVAVAGTVTRIAVLVTLFILVEPALSSVGLGLLAGAGVALIGILILWRALTPSLAIRLSSFSWPMLTRLLKTGVWVSFDNAGSLLFVGIDLLVVNALLGARAGGQYAVVIQWSALLRAFAGVVAGVFVPTMFAYYAREDFGGLIRYAKQSVKFFGLIMALPIALIGGLSRPLLRVWLGTDFIELAPLLSLVTLHLSINLMFTPLTSLQMAANRVRLPGIVTCIMGIANLGLALLFAGPLGWGMYGVAAAGAILLIAKNTLFTPYYGAYILRQPLGTFYSDLLPHLGLTLGTAAIGWWISSWWQIATWHELILCGCLISGVYLLLVLALRLSPAERNTILKMLSIRQVRQP
ncbi:MAG: lipopolysaccharide biosynthesis protein [Armatimonadota bacterium]